MKPFPVYLILLIMMVTSACSQAQDKHYKVGCIAFYNIENLFDTIDSPDTHDEEFLPGGADQWNTGKYKTKLQRLSEVICQIGDEMVKSGPVIIGLSEVENRRVLEDLVRMPKLAESGYEIVHYESPDERGVDVALLYQKAHFKVLSSKAVPLVLSDGDKTRDQLLVKGIFDGEELYVIVNHWPSRGGGEKASAPKRNAAARLCRSLVDDILKEDPKAKIIVMGDLNDDPNDESLVRHLRAKREIRETGPKDLFNPMYNILKKHGIGSLAYKDSWSLFDQILVSGNLLGLERSSYKFLKARVFNKPFLSQKSGQYKGYPERTFAGGVYKGGYSDHFPVYIFLVREK